MPVRRSHDRLYPEPPAANELPSPVAGAAVPLAEGRDAQGRIRSTATAKALASLPRRREMVPATLACDPRFAAYDRSRREWLRKRRSEVCSATGGVSHGVGAMLNAAAWSYAAAEFAAALAAETGNVDLFKASASLATTARGHDRMAWELASIEGATRHDESDPLAAIRAAAAERSRT
jgi:hypothetical protein